MVESSHHPDPFIISPTAPHKYTLILLHGTSQTGPVFAESFMGSFPSPASSRTTHPNDTTQPQDVKSTTLAEYFPNCKFVFPTGAPRKTTVFGGKETNAWFDITDFGDRTKGEMEMREGKRESSTYLSNLIKDEVELLYGGGANEEGGEAGEHEGKGRVILLGFSQGCAMGMMLLLSGELERLGVLDGFGGFVGLSGWLGFRRQINEAISDAASGTGAADDFSAERKSTTTYVRQLLGLDPTREEWVISTRGLDKPIFLGHGELDQKVKYEWGGQMRDTLARLGINVSFHSYEGLAHWWSDDEMGDVARFLERAWNT